MKEKIYLLMTIVCVILLSLPSNAFAVPMTWSANGHEYDVILLPGSSWDAARADAQSLFASGGWDLATITSAEEQAFINSLIPSGTTSTGIVQYWIGGFQPLASGEPGGNWQWINDEGLFWDNGPLQGVYSNWGRRTGEPNNSGSVLGYVAENSNPSNSVPEPSTFLFLSSGLCLAGFGLLRRRFKRD
jgi:Lectin C-type domain/PEP-CTERM motif